MSALLPMALLGGVIGMLVVLAFAGGIVMCVGAVSLIRNIMGLSRLGDRQPA